MDIDKLIGKVTLATVYEYFEAWKEIQRLARLGAAVEAMPFNSSLKRLPLNDSSDDRLKFPVGAFPWVFERPGENATEAADPLLALTWHAIPVTDGPLL